MEYFQGGPLRHVGKLPAMAADRYGEKPIFRFHSRELSCVELERQSNQIANVLSDHGLGLGDRVGLYIPNTLQFPQCYFGVSKAGGVPVPVNLRRNHDAVTRVLDDAGIDIVIGSPLLADEVQELAVDANVETLLLPGVDDDGPVDVVNMSHEKIEADDDFAIVERAYDDVATQLYTSGTTGDPKGVPLSHRNVLSTIESYTRTDFGVDPSDTMLLVLPLFHVYALNAVMSGFLYKGATMVLQARPEAQKMLRAIDENDVTKIAGVPALYKLMIDEYTDDPEEYDVSSLTDIISAAAPLSEETREAVEREWNITLGEGWGMTETAPAGTLEPLRGVSKGAGCVGPPLPNLEVKIADPDTRETKIAPGELSPPPATDVPWDDQDAVTGEIAVRGPQVFDGYHDRPEQTAAVFDDDGWFYTGDIARVDGDGFFWMIDRADDMMIVGGENVYPAEVERSLMMYPDVADVAVVAAPHEVKGAAPVAHVVPTEGSEVTEREIREFALENVAPYAHPRRVFFREELPRSATEKVQRFELEAETEQRLSEPLRSTNEEL